jgi:hypothetical protein
MARGQQASGAGGMGDSRRVEREHLPVAAGFTQVPLPRNASSS